ncbi:acyltransferase-domain-containing protein [Pseudovirgaria hyperparasitica]|uniref:Acyltransferase-domain-containing protein n=1 Tax=Pseudovirgaria hyperparasitica TaxID=470096 RepID=A0A6A6VWK4_9PEZI|nr:acyltransferase-domain-containing protein [Pseudovirgaria hyperparasitica]KAF2753637.1 acyltransferase-domain-containing protein [Pseudovirgaria hyperparasitica]
MKPKKDFGVGLNLGPTKLGRHPSGPPRHGEFGQAERAFTLGSTFISGVLAITASQFLGAPLKFIDSAFYDAYMAYTKESFAVLITSLTQWWAPTKVRVSGDESMKGQLIKLSDGSLRCNFSDRTVIMANHQLYTDWLYLWWIAYTNKMHGRIYIILKESLKKIPILGWGCQFYNFIFLSRKWEEDQPRFRESLSHLKQPSDPMWLIIFPEGTNLSAGTREKSTAWAKKNNLQDMKHQLLPRSTGLRFCLKELRESTDWLYDCTIAYEGVPAGAYGQDVFTLRSSFFEGRPPKSVNMHWRRFRIADIPLDGPKAFDAWLRNRWREKDYMLAYFAKHTRFPATSYWKDQLAQGADSKSESSIRSVARPAVSIETEIKSGRPEEFIRIFAPITALAMALFLAYGASPSDLPFTNGMSYFTQALGPLMGQVSLPTNAADLEKMLEHGVPGMSTPLSPPEVQMKGNTEEDKKKKLKYLKLFKDSLPKEVGLEAEQRRRVGKFVRELPDTKAARAAAMSGVRTGLQRNQSRTGTAAKDPSRPATSQRVPASSTALGSVARTAPSRTPGKSAAPTPGRTHIPETSVPVPFPPTKQTSANPDSPQYAIINGIRVQIQPSAKPTTPTIPESYLQTKGGVRIKTSGGQGKASIAQGSNMKTGYIETKGGVKIKQAAVEQGHSDVVKPNTVSTKVVPSVAVKAPSSGKSKVTVKPEGPPKIARGPKKLGSGMV